MAGMSAPSELDRTVGTSVNPGPAAPCGRYRQTMKTVLNLKWIENLHQLDRPAAAAKSLVDRVIPPRSVVKDLLSGTLLGHPVHPVQTDLVIGAWINSFVFDLLPGRWSRQAADRLIELGILTAVPTALSGLSDWADVRGAQRRVGLVHASANVTSLSFYIASAVARHRGARVAGRLLSLGGLGASMTAATLGGHLVYQMGVGVNQTAFEDGPTDWRPVIASADLAEGAPTAVTVDEVDLLLLRRGTTVYAVSNHCTHRGCHLNEGDFPGESTVVCPCHGSTFDLRSGAVLHGPATAPQPAYLTRMRDEQIEVRLAQGAPARSIEQ
jgi:nitrite reductase/ring-hydroxylating ferredoxin subunit